MTPPEVASGDMPSSKVDSATTEVSLVDAVVVGVTSHMETVSTVTVNTGVTTAVTSAPLGNDLAAVFVYVVISFFDSKASFVGTLGLTVTTAGSGSSRGGITTPIILDIAGVDILYRSIIQRRFSSTGDSD